MKYRNFKAILRIVAIILFIVGYSLQTIDYHPLLMATLMAFSFWLYILAPILNYRIFQLFVKKTVRNYYAYVRTMNNDIWEIKLIQSEIIDKLNKFLPIQAGDVLAVTAWTNGGTKIPSEHFIVVNATYNVEKGVVYSGYLENNVKQLFEIQFPMVTIHSIENFNHAYFLCEEDGEVYGQVAVHRILPKDKAGETIGLFEEMTRLTYNTKDPQNCTDSNEDARKSSGSKSEPGS